MLVMYGGIVLARACLSACLSRSLFLSHSLILSFSHSFILPFSHSRILAFSLFLSVSLFLTPTLNFLILLPLSYSVCARARALAAALCSSCAVWLILQEFTPQTFTQLSDLIKFWRVAEQFSMLGSAYRQRALVGAIFLAFFGDTPDTPASAAPRAAELESHRSARGNTVRQLVTPLYMDCMDELDAAIQRLAEGDAVIPFNLFTPVQAAVEAILVHGPLFRYLRSRWCPAHGCLATQCNMLGCACAAAAALSLSRATGQFTIPQQSETGLLTVLLVHVKQRYEFPYPCLNVLHFCVLMIPNVREQPRAPVVQGGS